MSNREEDKYIYFEVFRFETVKTGAPGARTTGGFHNKDQVPCIQKQNNGMFAMIWSELLFIVDCHT